VLEVVSANTSAHPSRKQEEGGQHDRHRDDLGDDGADEDREHAGAHQVDRHDDQSAIEPVGQHAGVQAEDERRQPLEEGRQRDQERVVRLRGDQQRTGGERDAVTEVGDPRRPDHPAEAGAQPPWREGVEHSGHRGTLGCTGGRPHPV
jgi:hypothetical protein